MPREKGSKQGQDSWNEKILVEDSFRLRTDMRFTELGPAWQGLGFCPEIDGESLRDIKK